MIEKNNIRLTSIHHIATQVLALALGFLLPKWLLNTLGTRTYGMYVFIQRVTVTMQMADFRPSAVLKYTLPSLAEEDKNLVFHWSKRLVKYSVLGYLILSLVLSIYYAHSKSLSDLGFATIFLISLGIFLSFSINSVVGRYEGVFKSRNILWKTWVLLLIKPLIIYLMVFSFVKENNFTVVFYLDVVLGCVALFIYWWKIEVVQIGPLLLKNKTITGFSFKDYLKSSVFYIAAAGSSGIVRAYDVILIGSLIGLEEVAAYSLSKSLLIRGTDFTLTTVISRSVILSARTAKIDKYVRALKKVQSAQSLIVIIVLLLVYDVVIRVWVGENMILSRIEVVLLASVVFLETAIKFWEEILNTGQRYALRLWLNLFTLAALIGAASIIEHVTEVKLQNMLLGFIGVRLGVILFFFRDIRIFYGFVIISLCYFFVDISMEYKIVLLLCLVSLISALKAFRKLVFRL